MIAILQIFIPCISFPYLKIQMSDISMHLFHSFLSSVCQSTGIYLSVCLTACLSNCPSIFYLTLFFFSQSTESSPSQHIYELCEEDEYIDRLHFVKFETKFIESCLDFIQEKLGDSLRQNKTIHVTGGGAHKYKDLLASKLGVM